MKACGWRCIGAAPEQRLSLEANYGYLLISNGVPIGYGGVSPLYRQANTGINVFDAFRGSEAAFLWAQTLRAFRTLFGVRCFVINGYQFGAGNREAIASGAYWFYYRLGFRPGHAEDADVAEEEAARLRRHPAARTSAALLRRLARGDLRLDLADFDASDYFEEPLLNRIGAAVARRIAAIAVRSHRDGEATLVRDTMRALGIDRAPAAARRRALARLAPVAALLDLERWSATERQFARRMAAAEGRCAGARLRARRDRAVAFLPRIAEAARSEQQRNQRRQGVKR